MHYWNQRTVTPQHKRTNCWCVRHITITKRPMKLCSKWKMYTTRKKSMLRRDQGSRSMAWNNPPMMMGGALTCPVDHTSHWIQHQVECMASNALGWMNRLIGCACWVLCLANGAGTRSVVRSVNWLSNVWLNEQHNCARKNAVEWN